MKKPYNKKLLGACCGILTGACWGLSSVFSQYLFTNTSMTSSWFVAVRMFFAGVFMIGLTVACKREELVRLLKNKNDFVRCIVTGVLGTMLFQFACYGAVERSNAATAIVLQYLCPAMVMVYTCIRRKKLPKWFETLALLMAISGVFLIATHGNIHELVITSDALLWGIGCAFFMSVGTLIPERLYEEYSTQTITSVALCSGGIIAAICVNPVKNPPQMDAKAFAIFLLAVFFGSVIAYAVYAIAIKQIGSANASLFACAEIPITTVLSVLLLHNRFTILDLIGFLLIASTIFILSVKSDNKDLMQERK